MISTVAERFFRDEVIVFFRALPELQPAASLVCRWRGRKDNPHNRYLHSSATENVLRRLTREHLGATTDALSALISSSQGARGCGHLSLGPHPQAPSAKLLSLNAVSSRRKAVEPRGLEFLGQSDRTNRKRKIGTASPPGSVFRCLWVASSRDVVGSPRLIVHPDE